MERFGASFPHRRGRDLLPRLLPAGHPAGADAPEDAHRDRRGARATVTPEFTQLADDYPEEFQTRLRRRRPRRASRAALRAGQGDLHRRGLLALPLAVRAAGLEGGSALRPGVDAGGVPERDEPAAPLRHAPGRSRSHPRGRRALERLAHGAPLRAAERRAVLGDAVVSVVLRREPAADRAGAGAGRVSAVARQLGREASRHDLRRDAAGADRGATAAAARRRDAAGSRDAPRKDGAMPKSSTP